MVISSPPQLDRMGIGIDFIRREIAKDEYVETVERSFGPMKKLYTLVEFSPSVDRGIAAAVGRISPAGAVCRGRRRGRVGAGADRPGVWALEGRHLDRGYYTKRLFLGVPAAIIGLESGCWVWQPAE